MKRIQVICLLFVISMTMTAQAALAGGQAGKDSKPSLYQRLGGSETLGKIFDDLGPRMAADPLLAKFFQGQSPEALTRQRNNTVEFLCQASGGPCEHKGQTLKKAHGVLHINGDQWKAFMKHLTETLDHLKIADREKHDFLAMVGRFKSDVVSKK